jgi:hypothetical protein
MPQPKELQLLWLCQRDLPIIADNNACQYALYIQLTERASQLKKVEDVWN